MLPYQGLSGEHIIKMMQYKFRHYFKKDLKINVQFNTTKLAYYTSTKDCTLKFNNSYVIYQFHYPGCYAKYVGETQCTFYKRTLQHGHEQTNSAVYKHLLGCRGYLHTTDILKIDFIEFMS